jgi:hypothetical protein
MYLRHFLFHNGLRQGDAMKYLGTVLNIKMTITNIEFGECLILFGSEIFAFPSSIQEIED